MEFKRVKAWVETTTTIQALAVLLGGAVTGRMAWFFELPLWAIFLGSLLGIVIVLLVLIYKKNDPEKAWLYNALIFIVTIGALIAIDAKVTGWLSKSLFNPEQQVRKWLDELHYTSTLINPPPQGQVFRFDVKEMRENGEFSIYQEITDPNAIVIFGLAKTEIFLNALPEGERDKLWLDMGLALLRSDIRISPVAKFGPLQVVNWFPFGPETNKQQFLVEIRRFIMAVDTINVIFARKALVKDPISEKQH